jgi:uncharacterized RDD family membrane protein YckC
VPHFDDQPTHTEPAGSPVPAAEPGAAEPAQSPAVAQAPAISTAPPPAPVPLWPPPPPEWQPSGYGNRNGNGNGNGNENGSKPVARYPRFAGSAPLDVLGRPLASWLKRALAIAVDFLVLSFALSEFGHEVFPLVLSSSTSKPPSGQVLEFLGVSALVWIGYLTLLGSSRRGQTLGMMLYGIAVRDDAGGGQVGVGRATLRSVILVGLSSFFIDLLWPLWDKKRQSLHDKAAGTVVVDVRLAALAEQLRQGGR